MIKTNKFKYNSNQKILNLSINHQNHVIFLLIKVGLPEKSKKKIITNNDSINRWYLNYFINPYKITSFMLRFGDLS